MPAVRGEARRWMSRETKKAVLDAVHASLVLAFEVPDSNRNQQVVEYAAEDFEASADKGEHFTVITIEAFAGRSVDAKRALYQDLVRRLEPLGIPSNDLMVIVHDVPLESWGTRGGKAACDLETSPSTKG